MALLTASIGSKYERNLPCPITEREFPAILFRTRRELTQFSSTKDDFVVLAMGSVTESICTYYSDSAAKT
jgi:hypothetical protein